MDKGIVEQLNSIGTPSENSIRVGLNKIGSRDRMVCRHLGDGTIGQTGCAGRPLYWQYCLTVRNFRARIPQVVPTCRLSTAVTYAMETFVRECWYRTIELQNMKAFYQTFTYMEIPVIEKVYLL
jgi:hypothetical protein